MCHTCIHNNSDFCHSCLKQTFRSGSQYENQQMVFRMFVSGIVISSISLAYQLMSSELIDYLNLFLWFCFGVSVMSMYYISSKTDVYSETSKVPFIGAKLAIVLLILTTVSGGPFLYFLYKTFLVGKAAYLKHNKID